MTLDSPHILAAFIFVVALVYASVGQAGASGYLAVMAFYGLDAEFMRPTALVLNILVALIVTLQFERAGCISWPLARPFILGSVPFAFLGGLISLPNALFRPLIGAILLFSAYRLISATPRMDTRPPKPLQTPIALAAGAVIGLLSGLTGMGGGVLLGPFLLLMRSATAREAAGASAIFILLNSLAALGGQLSILQRLPASLPLLALSAGAGGAIGAVIGSRALEGPVIQRLLAAVLVFAGLKMILTP